MNVYHSSFFQYNSDLLYKFLEKKTEEKEIKDLKACDAFGSHVLRPNNQTTNFLT